MFMKLGLFRGISLMVMVIVAGATFFATSVQSRDVTIVVCGIPGADWNCSQFESNGDCPSAGSCSPEGYCSLFSTDLSRPSFDYTSVDFSEGPDVREYEAKVIFCGWRYFCGPACVDVNGTDKCVNLLSTPLGGLDLIREVGPCQQP